MIFDSVTEKHEKVLIIAGGESLIGFDINKIKDFDGAIITVNNVVFHLPRADYWITVDPMSKGKPQEGMRRKIEGCKYYCAYPDLDKTPWDRQFYSTIEGVSYLERIVPTNDYSLQEDKDKITTGGSTYGALGLAYHFGAKEITILGLDGYGYGHWYDTNSPFNAHGIKDFKQRYLDNLPWIYSQSVRQLEAKGCKVVNGSKNSIVDCFERMTPNEAINYFK